MSASEKLKTLDGAATGGPWESLVFDHLRPGSSPLPMRSVYGDKRQNILRDEPSESDAALIATLRSALPQIVALTSAVEKLYAEAASAAPLWDEINDALIELDKALS